MKYRNPKTGEFKDLLVKVTDTLPVGSIVEYEGETIPEGWEKVEDNLVADGAPILAGYRVNGKDVYVKRINIASLPNATTGVYPTGLTNITCDHLDGLYNGGVPINFVYPNQGAYVSGIGTYFEPSDASIRIITGLDKRSQSGYVDIFFTYNEEV